MQDAPHTPESTQATPAPTREGAPPPAAHASPVTRRSVWLGCVLIVLNAFWVTQMEAVKAGGRTSTFSIFFVAIFDLFVLVGGNALVRRRMPRSALTPGELITIYVMMNLGVALAGTDLLQVIVPVAAHPVYRATPENRWGTLFLEYLPGWLAVRDLPTVQDLYRGRGSFWTAAHLGHWAPVILGWSALLMLLLFVMLCLNVLLRRAWIRHDRLSFPLVALPLELAQPGTPLLRSRLLWIGFALATLVNAVNGLHVLTPSVPEIPVAARDIQGWFTTPPWNAIGTTHLSFFPWAIGLGFLLPTDLLFSGCFFFWCWRLLRVGLTAYGLLDNRAQAPWVSEHTLGGYLALCLLGLWHARRELGRAARPWTEGRSPENDSDTIWERWALPGAVAGSLLLVVLGIAAGLSPGVSALYMGLFLAMSVAITRIRAEFGAPVHDFAADPGGVMVQLAGARSFEPRELTVFSVLFGFTRIQRGNLMPFQMEGFKMADQTGLAPSGLCRAILIAGFVGTLAGFAALLSAYYDLGMGSAKVLGPQSVFPNETYPRLASWLVSPPRANGDSIRAVLVGAAFTILLSQTRLRWIGFPFHPVGFAVSGSWNMSLLWLPLSIALLIKVLVLRYGGLGLYRRLLPFFLGLLLGDFISTAAINLLAIALDWPVYGLYAA